MRMGTRSEVPAFSFQPLSGSAASNYNQSRRVTIASMNNNDINNHFYFNVPTSTPRTFKAPPSIIPTSTTVNRSYKV